MCAVCYAGNMSACAPAKIGIVAFWMNWKENNLFSMQSHQKLSDKNLLIQSDQPMVAKSMYSESRQHSLELDADPQLTLRDWRLIVRWGKVSMTMKGLWSLCIEMGRFSEMHVSQDTWTVCERSWSPIQFFTGNTMSIFSHSSFWSTSLITKGLDFVKFKLVPQWPISDNKKVWLTP